MRVLLIALMMVLLPLRGWMGDAMAISMMNMQMGGGAQAHAMSMPGAAHGISLQPQQEMSQAAVQASGHEDCAGMSPTTASAHEPFGEAAGTMAGCESCSLCQVCNTVVLNVEVFSAATLSLPQATPGAALAHFASVHPQRGQKPPIS